MGLILSQLTFWTWFEYLSASCNWCSRFRIFWESLSLCNSQIILVIAGCGACRWHLKECRIRCIEDCIQQVPICGLIYSHSINCIISRGRHLFHLLNLWHDWILNNINAACFWCDVDIGCGERSWGWGNTWGIGFLWNWRCWNKVRGASESRRVPALLCMCYHLPDDGMTFFRY